MNYQVDLEMFRGPLDLLLYLVRKNEVDICDIPIAKIAQQFRDYMGLIQLVDVEWAGEFLVMAATLMEIKSKLLLPRADESEEDADDPRLELVKQLIEYKKYKEVSKILEERSASQQLRLSREPVDRPRRVKADEQPISKVELWDLVSAFGRLMEETTALQPRRISLDETPIHVYMDQIVKRLQQRDRLAFSEIFTPPYTRGRLIGLFLAVLELVKGRQVRAQQSELNGDIEVRLAATESDQPMLPV
ncbi:MAG: segregation and condensation protein A [Gemmataceae bacterium]